jgi:flavin-dependent dehydrogenase
MEDDVIVIGGGPAGATVSALLARQGYRVRLFEKEKFPRRHVGESLLPFCYDIFSDLGVLEEMAQHFVRKPTVRFLSSDGSVSTNWCFNHVIHDESFLSFQVDRPIFDQILLENARRKGVQVFEETRVTNVKFPSNGKGVIVSVDPPGGQNETCRAKFLIDASGRSSFLATRNRWRRPQTGLERTAIWTHWKGIQKLKGGLEIGASLIIYLGGVKQGWIWVFPLGKGHLTIGVVLESAYLREKKRAASQQNDKDWKKSIYLEEIYESSFLADLLEEDAWMSDEPVVEGDYSYFSDVKFGDRFALIGDAGQFIDPIFSSGVFLSMKSASLVAAELAMILPDRLHEMDGMAQVYEKINGAYELVHALIKMYYNPENITFAEVGMVARHQGHEDAMAAGHYFLAGDFFENNTKYRSFLNLLGNPRYFDIYRENVIKKYHAEPDNCNLEDTWQIFPPNPL